MSAARPSAAMQSSVLVLNRLYVAIQVMSVRRAFCLLCKGLAEVVSVENGGYVSYNFESWREVSEWKAQIEGKKEHEDWIQSVNFEVQLSYDLFPRNVVKFNRRNIFLRDENRCQYCGHKFSTQHLSLDHVVPRSQGGQTNWENIVCACLKCNVRKGGRTPYQAGMRLFKKPVKPKRSPMLSHQLTIVKYESWKQFLDDAYWNVELQN
ncbi:MAG: HNH endonuclease [Planctomycetota bacterium]|nr:HNH endonuclease [Planctomycetota bacterium]